MYRKFLKGLIDRAVAFIALIILLPLFVLCIFLLILFNRNEVFFVQPRPGKDERIFNLIKFKTMTDERDAVGNLLPDKDRLTWIGGFIRRSSLDELPQLINILKGDMSFIGPRPLLVDYLPLYNRFQRRRHDVKPGLSGWAQVNGRNTISWEKKFEYDVWYVNHQSFLLDVRILLLTVRKVLKAEGINAEGTVTMERFTGDVDSKY
ncbi:sugar transferase [Fulvivirga ulvae]|uniref:sugar transferase n=1 Tax=Fulvivirga ulvae TaxID=2904245 RepID=UPI001F34216B|nr:sugar transferase [Fulvivirga ulvae]UII31643.1 sugar transferase [Fulvivirga ulvae]